MNMPENSYKVNIVRLYADQLGESHFTEEVLNTTVVDFAPPAPPLYISTPLEAKRTMFLLVPEDWYGDLHPAPNRQFLILARGGLEVKVSDGEVRRFKPGDAVRMEDTFGKGHATRSIDSDAVVAVVQF
jgi:hypothetical protein